jgi:dihydrolipoamide dehydrogenase
VEVRIPELGDAKNVSVVEWLVTPGTRVAQEQALLTLETEKATMDVPSPVAGVLRTLRTQKGDLVASGTIIAEVEVADAAPAPAPEAVASTPLPTPASRAPTPASHAPTPVSRPSAPLSRASAPPIGAAPAGALDLVVLGAGPGGYTAAFRAADLGLKVTLIERWPILGGVCLNVGCIPSKALLHAAKVIEQTHEMADCGILFPSPTIDYVKLRAWKNRVVGRLTGGLTVLAKQRKVDVVHGDARFVAAHTLEVRSAEGTRRIDFKQCIIAAGSESVRLPGLPDDPRVIDSTGALELPADCRRLLVIGGGIIGLEMACVYDALGVRVTVVELSDGLMPGTDRDLVRPLQKRLEKRYERILLKTRVATLEAHATGLRATFEGPGAPEPEEFDRVLVAVGRRANGNLIDAAAAGVAVDARGIIAVDKQQRTNVTHIFAIGDIAGVPMLAHKATHEAKVAAEVAAGHKSSFDARCIPSVAYTDPEIAWVGVTETEARAQGLEFGKGVFPWAASGRSLAINRDEGFTKILFDTTTHRVIGAGIVGTNAGDLIAEIGLAIEMGADAADIGLTVHAHPTLSETVGMAAEAFEGTLTDLYLPKR